jgi:hypothetical protein
MTPEVTPLSKCTGATFKFTFKLPFLGVCPYMVEELAELATDKSALLASLWMHTFALDHPLYLAELDVGPRTCLL